MNLALPYTASATDASDTLISAPDATHMSLDTCFYNKSLSVLMGKAPGLHTETGRSIHVVISRIDSTKSFKLPVSQKEHGKHSQSLGLVAKILRTNSKQTPNYNQYS
jgi:hypothetical protein